MESDRVAIVEYDPRWPLLYESAANELRQALAPWLVAIEHIGSTAVPGLAAKPVIDILVGVTSLEKASDIVRGVEALGYEYVAEHESQFPDRRYFQRLSPTSQRSHHVHVVERSNLDWWDRHIAFRDWLKAHPEDRDRYAHLKRQLAEEFESDRAAYTDGKSDFVLELERKSMNRDR